MEVKKAIKKMIAFGTGATMLGATLMGAMAADLKDYPAPFLKDGKFDALIVVGDAAASADVVGSIDIATGLQSEAVIKKTVSSGTTGTTVSSAGESAKIEMATNKLNIDNNLTEVKTTALTYTDLPNLLKKGTFTNKLSAAFPYEQEIKFSNLAEYGFFADTDYKDKVPTLGILAQRNKLLLNYTIKFTKDMESTGATSMVDLLNKPITILGKEYTITTATNGTNIKLDLMGGSTKDTLAEGDEKTYTVGGKDYTVKVSIIDASSNAKFIVNGETTDSITTSESFKLKDGSEIGVTDVSLQNWAGGNRQVEFFVGAQKITIENGQKLEKGGDDVDDIYTFIGSSVSGTKTTINRIRLDWIPNDDVFIAEGSPVTMPGLSSFKISSEALTAPIEESIKIQNHGTDMIELRAPLKSGSVSFDVLYGNGTHFTRLGDSSMGLVTTNGSADGGANLTYDRDVQRYFVTAYDAAGGTGIAATTATTGESYLMEVSTISASDGVTLKDVASGTKYEKKKFGDAVSIGSATLTVKNYSSTDNYVEILGGANVYFDRVITATGYRILLPVNSTPGVAGGPGLAYAGSTNTIDLSSGSANSSSYKFVMTEEDKNNNIASGNTINATAGWSSAKTSVTTVVAIYSAIGGSGTSSTTFETATSSNKWVGYVASDLGTKTIWDKSPDQDTIEIIYHGGETYGNVYVAPTETTFAAQAAGGTTTQEVVKIAVGTAKLASEVADVAAQNVILVGGPCANKAAAAAMGNPADCTTGFVAGKAKLKLYDTGKGKTALLVAGYSADDTRRASRVIAEHAKYTLTGAEVEVTGTSMTDITVSAAK